eukprot:CAMPEP_0205801542 /NCGR_PEP_ID=MMETSP0205-20121125/3553_1 /ASSEMBLY_ACC=CAM_ASM_000278 /TAXON_ID=36767 /ORGANISM="Euplotes focardii, Strain TN1" /LENGTH=63 /DNA_ID=CAMNT_0053066439 /DNA_START=105 /DNA_END=296 /DNA_ORIENTATION=+
MSQQIFKRKPIGKKSGIIKPLKMNNLLTEDGRSSENSDSNREFNLNMKRKKYGKKKENYQELI